MTRESETYNTTAVARFHSIDSNTLTWTILVDAKPGLCRGEMCPIVSLKVKDYERWRFFEAGVKYSPSLLSRSRTLLTVELVLTAEF